MKIVIDLTSLADHFSGIERFALSITQELIKDQNHAYTLLFKNEIHEQFKTTGPNVEKRVVRGRNKLIFNQIVMPAALWKTEADWYLFPAFPAPFLTFKKHSVSAIHDMGCWDCPDTNKRRMIWYFKLLYWKAAVNDKKIITVSEFSKGRIKEILHSKEENVWVIHNGLSDTFLNYTKDKDQEKEIICRYRLPERYILCLSTLEPRKNLRLLIEAYAKLVREKKLDAHLVLAGRKGWMTDNLLKNIEREISEKITFTGFVEDGDLPCIYKKACLFVFPTRYEGFGIPPLEAMYMGTPVISSDSSSMPEVLMGGAVFFRNNDAEDLQRKMEAYFMMGSKEKEELMEKGKAVAEHYKWSEEAQKLKMYLMSGNIYKTLYKSRGKKK